MRYSIAPLLLIALLGLRAPPAAADDEKNPDVEVVLASLKAAKKDEDSGAWIRAVQRVPPVYDKAGEKDRKRLMHCLGDAVKAKSYTVQKAALVAFVKIDDGDAAWKAGLKSIFPRVKSEQVGVLDIDYFRTLYVLHPDDAIEPLLTYMRKSKTLELVPYALRVLGSYGMSKRRVEVLKDVVKALIASAPGKRQKGGGGSPRWKALAKHIPVTLNDLTGRDWNGAEWGAAWKANKKKPEVLFVEPLPK